MKISEKYALTIHEASEYFSIGERKLYMLAAEHTDSFAFRECGGNTYIVEWTERLKREGKI